MQLLGQHQLLGRWVCGACSRAVVCGVHTYATWTCTCTCTCTTPVQWQQPIEQGRYTAVANVSTSTTRRNHPWFVVVVHSSPSSRLSGEVDTPSKTFPRALLWAVLLVVASYFLPTLAALGVAVDTADWQLGYYGKVAQQVHVCCVSVVCLCVCGAVIGYIDGRRGAVLHAEQPPRLRT